MSKSASVGVVAQAVADAFGLQVDDLLGPRRFSRLSVPRQIAYALARKHTALSYPQIGAYFRGRDHTTVQHGVRRVEAGDFAHEAERIERAEAMIEKRRRAVFYRHGALTSGIDRGVTA